MKDKKTLWEVMYQTLWEMWIQEIEEDALANCLTILKDYLVEMLESIEVEK